MEKSVYKPLPETYERQNLMDVIPLKNPLSMLVDPASVCNFKCSFCPTGNPELIKSTGRNQVLLSLDLFKKIIADIEQFETDLEVLRLYKDGEPLLNPNFVDFVKLAKSCPKIKRVETTTNGSKLTRKMSDNLIEAGIDRIVISIEGLSKEKYKEFVKVNFDFDGFIENLTYLFGVSRGRCQIHIKTVHENLCPINGEDEFKAIFGEICDRMFIEDTVPSWPEFALDYLSEDQQAFLDKKENEVLRKQVCAYLFYSLSINADGEVSPCCVDWNRKLSLGNLNDQSILDVWNGKKLQDLRFKHLQYDRSQIESCSSCGQIDYCSMENLDAHADKILEKMSKNAYINIKNW
tara:strand:+ start:5077 stop:6123 length:1047 start_codon:yes stop_codon:yes gene_type:complete